MSRQKNIIVGLGEILWDMLPGGKKLGGAPANFAYYVQELGERSFIAGSVGTDSLGDQMIKKLDRLGLNRKYVQVDRNHPTGKVDVDIDRNGKPKYVFAPNVAWDYISFSKKLLLLANRADAVCFGTLCQRSPYSRGSIRKFLRATKPKCIRIYDINLRKPFFNKQVIHTSLGFTDVLKLSDEELPVVAKLLRLNGSQDSILRQLLRRYHLTLIALTAGAKGSLLFRKDKVSFHEAYKVKIADTVGAGDSFTAALAVGLLKGDDLDTINSFANRLASFVCSKPGAMVKVAPTLTGKKK